MRADRDVYRDARLLCSAEWARAKGELVERLRPHVFGLEGKELHQFVSSAMMAGGELARVGFDDTRPEHEP